VLFLILIIFLVLFLFGGHYGYSRWGYQGGLGIGGVLILILLLWLLFGGVMAPVGHWRY
jgi:hypothetical protein